MNEQILGHRSKRGSVQLPLWLSMIFPTQGFTISTYYTLLGTACLPF